MILFKDWKNNKMIEKDFFPTNIADNVIIGSNSTILPVKICSGSCNWSG
jgi:hypothetical protein